MFTFCAELTRCKIQWLKFLVYLRVIELLIELIENSKLFESINFNIFWHQLQFTVSKWKGQTLRGNHICCCSIEIHSSPMHFDWSGLHDARHRTKNHRLPISIKKTLNDGGDRRERINIIFSFARVNLPLASRPSLQNQSLFRVCVCSANNC